MAASAAADWTGVDYARHTGPDWSTPRVLVRSLALARSLHCGEQMKQTNRKQLRLNHETIRTLSGASLQRVAGGISRFECGTENVNCGTDGTGGVTCNSDAAQCQSGPVQCGTANCTGFCQ